MLNNFKIFQKEAKGEKIDRYETGDKMKTHCVSLSRKSERRKIESLF